MAGRRPGGDDRADRHRWALDGPRCGEEPRLRRGGHLARPVRAAAGRPRPRRVHPGRAPGAGRGRVRAHGDVRHRGRVLDGQRGDRHQRRQRLPALGRRRAGTRPPCCGTARTRTSGRRSTSTEPSRAGSRRRSSCTARRCPTTTTSTPTPRAGPRTTSTHRRWRSSSTPTRAASRSASDIAEAHARAHACDPVSAFGGVIATNRPVSVAMAQQVAEVFTEVIAAPAYEDGAVEVLQAKKNIRILVVEPADRGGIETRGISGGMLMQAVDTVDAEHDTAASWELVSGEPAVARGAGRPGVRLAGLPRGQVQRHPAGPRRRLGRGRHGSGQPGRLVSARGGAGRASGRRGRWPPPTRSSRSPTARRS